MVICPYCHSTPDPHFVWCVVYEECVNCGDAAMDHMLSSGACLFLPGAFAFKPAYSGLRSIDWKKISQFIALCADP